MKVLGFTGIGFFCAFVFAVPAFAKGGLQYDIVPPKFKFGNDISVNLNGRVIYDYVNLEANFDEFSGQKSRDENFEDSFFKRAIWSLEGKIGKNWKFKTEHGFEGDAPAAWDDAYLEYSLRDTSIYIGSNHQTNPMDGQNSSAVIQFANRSVVTSAFSQSSRNMGIAARKFGKNWQVIVGIYGDNINVPSNRYFSGQRYFQTRATFAPINQKNEILHIGASMRMRNRADDKMFSYSARPIQYAIGTQFLQSGAIGKSDLTFGGELFYAKGAFSTQFEAQTLISHTNVENLNFNGSYLEAAYFLTGENRTYNAVRGLTTFTKPKKPFGNGGFGAISVLARIDYLELQGGNLGKINAPITSWRNRGGYEYGYSLGLNWHPSERVIIRTSMSQTNIKQSRGEISSNYNITVNPIGDGVIKSFNIRTQIGF